ncbi:MAG: hypothetical protein GTN99_01185 [Candidatus Dadabacteria bacterium]|nr:hypothetical protein [Candidatus Dadabacteria bacterium]NIT12892.1 hypothetical protein [Candidatus Dadabacteria bacterium]
MPAKIITLHSKTKADLKKKYNRTIKDARKHGMSYVKEGYDDRRIKRAKGGYELVITVHS